MCSHAQEVFWGGRSKDGRKLLLGSSSIWFGPAFSNDKGVSVLSGIVAVGGGPIAIDECSIALEKQIPLYYIQAPAKNLLNGPYGVIHDWYLANVSSKYCETWMLRCKFCRKVFLLSEYNDHERVCSRKDLCSDQSIRLSSTDSSQYPTTPGSAISDDPTSEDGHCFFFRTERECANLSTLLTKATIKSEVTNQSLIIEKHLGEGAYGNVYSASYGGMNVCTKVLVSRYFFDNTDSRTLRKRRKEIEAQETLVSLFAGTEAPNLVIPLEVIKNAKIELSEEQRVRSMRPDKGWAPVIVLPFHTGGDFWCHLCNLRDLLPPDVVRYYFSQCVNAVALLHSKGYCHRDLKVENVVLSGDKKTLFIIDYGLMRNCLRADPLRPAVARSVTFEAPLPNHPARFAEDFYDDAGHHKIDIFGLGAILAIMTFGINRGQKLVDSVRAAPSQDPDPVLRLLAHAQIPEGLKLLFRKLLNNNPNYLSNIDEIQADPWMQEQCALPQKAADLMTELYPGKSPRQETITLTQQFAASEDALLNVQQFIQDQLHSLSGEYTYVVERTLQEKTEVRYRESGGVVTYPLEPPGLESIVHNLFSDYVSEISEYFKVKVELFPGIIKITPDRPEPVKAIRDMLNNQLSHRLTLNVVATKQEGYEVGAKQRKTITASDDQPMLFLLTIRAGKLETPAVELEWPPNGFCTAAQWIAFTETIRGVCRPY